MKYLNLILIAVLTSLQGFAVPATYKNPIIMESVPDPTVMQADDGFYYLMGTEDIWNVPVFRSPDLVNWVQTGTVFTRDNRPAEGQVWAPELCRIHGKYVLFYSVNIPDETSPSTYVGYAVADHPAGPWTNRGKLFDEHEVGCRNAIDPFYYQENGKHYLFWGSTTNMFGMEISVSENIDITFDLSKKVQTAGLNIEGTEIYKRDEWYYMFASIGSYAWTNYRVVVGRSKNIFGPYTDRNGVSFLEGGDALGSATSLTTNNYKFTGNGHNAPVITDGAGDHWLICHGHVKDQEFNKRMPLLSRLCWDKEGWPYIKTSSPPHSEQEAPRFPSEWSVDNPATSAMSASYGYYDVFQMSAQALEALSSDARNRVTLYAPEADGRTITRLSMRKYTPRPVSGVDGDDAYLSYFATGSGLSNVAFSTGDKGINLQHITPDTRLRICLRTDAEPEMFGMEFFNSSGTPAFRCAVNAYAEGYPVIAHWPTDNGWIGLDLPLGRIAGIYPGFDLTTLKTTQWIGDYVKIYAGKLKDSNFSIDAFYLYTPADFSGVDNVDADAGTPDGISFDGRTVESTQCGIEVASLSGQRVMYAAGHTLDTSALLPGIYLCRSGSGAVKIVINRR